MTKSRLVSYLHPQEKKVIADAAATYGLSQSFFATLCLRLGYNEAIKHPEKLVDVLGTFGNLKV